MYNAELNERWTSALREYVADRRVLIVGNAVSLFANEFGELIDSYDVVMRLGKGFPYPEHKKHLGSKMDIWMSGTLRMDMYQTFKSAPFQIFNMTQMGMYDSEQRSLMINKCLLNGKYQIYRDYFLVGDIQAHKNIIRRVYGDKPSARISQGAVAIDYFLNTIKTQRELAIVGFDFFETNVAYELEGKVHQVASWHLPVPRYENPSQLPHSVEVESAHIKKLIADGRVKFYSMKPIAQSDQAVVDLVGKYRPKGAVA